MNEPVGFLMAGNASAFADMASICFSAVYAGVKFKRPSASEVCGVIGAVVSKMANPIHYGEVLKTVIKGISIEMMNMFIGGKWTSESLFHDETMFIFPSDLAVVFMCTH